jgi:hypothetical protein
MIEKPNVNNDTEVRIHAMSDRSEANFVRTNAKVSNSLVCSLINGDGDFSLSLTMIP